MTDTGKSGGRGVAILLITCIAIVAFWEIMANRSNRPWQPFDLTTADFDKFFPSSDEWTIRALPVSSSPTEPNILAFELSPKVQSKVESQKSQVGEGETSQSSPAPAPHYSDTTQHVKDSDSSSVLSSVASAKEEALAKEDTPLPRYSLTSGHTSVPVLVRLVHGYNMPDCMRIKGYTVELLSDTREGSSEFKVQGSKLKGSTFGGQFSKLNGNTSLEETRGLSASRIPHPASRIPPSLQLWLLTSATGDESIWVTAMLRAGNLEKTDVDVRSMAFPRIGTPIDPNWMPHGITLKSLRHPVKNFRRFIQSKWNNSRRDLATFLRLKQPAWASEEMLTLVASSKDTVMKPEDEKTVTEQVTAALLFVHTALKAEWDVSE